MKRNHSRCKCLGEVGSPRASRTASELHRHTFSESLSSAGGMNAIRPKDITSFDNGSIRFFLAELWSFSKTIQWVVPSMGASAFVVVLYLTSLYETECSSLPSLIKYATRKHFNMKSGQYWRFITSTRCVPACSLLQDTEGDCFTAQNSHLVQLVAMIPCQSSLNQQPAQSFGLQPQLAVPQPQGVVGNKPCLWWSWGGTVRADISDDECMWAGGLVCVTAEVIRSNDYTLG